MKDIICLTCGEKFRSNWGRQDLTDHEKIHAKDKDCRDLGFEDIADRKIK